MIVQNILVYVIKSTNTWNSLESSTGCWQGHKDQSFRDWRGSVLKKKEKNMKRGLRKFSSKHGCLSLSQTTNFRLFQTGRVCKRQFHIW